MIKVKTAVRPGWRAGFCLMVLVALASLAASACGDEPGAPSSSSSPSPIASVSPGRGAGESDLLLWTFKTGGLITTSAAVADGTVLVGSEDGFLYALDSQTGRQNWRYSTGGPSGPTGGSVPVSGGAAFCRSSDGYLYAVDVESGRLRWRFKTSSWAGPAGAAAVADGSVFVVAGRGRLCALDQRTGREIWTQKTRSDGRIAPVAAEGRVYLGTRQGLVAFAAATGKRLWVFRPLLQVVSAAPVVSGGVVYGVGSGWMNALWAVDAQSGRPLKWGFPLSEPSASSPVASEGAIYFTGSRGRYWLHAADARSGKELWNAHPVEEDDSLSPAVSGNLLCIAGYKTLYGVDARTGHERWRFETGKEVRNVIVTSPTVSNGVAYVGTSDGYLYAVGSRPAVSYAEAPEAGGYRHKIGGTGTVGWSFEPSVDISVTHLGCFSPEPGGLESSHRVGIFDAKSERLLDAVTLGHTSPLEGYFSWDSLRRPLVLKAGRTYLIGTHTLDDETLYEEGLPTEQWAPEVVFGELLTSYGRSGGRFMAPTDPTVGANFDIIVWMSPNFKFVPVSAASASSPTP